MNESTSWKCGNVMRHYNSNLLTQNFATTVARSLADRMAAKMGKAKKAAAPAPKRAGRGAAKKNNYVESDDEEEAFDTIECDADLSQLDMSTFDIADLTPAKKGKGKGKKAATKKAATKKAPAKKAKKVESEDEFEEEVVVPRARGGGKAKKTVDYAAMADDESEDEEGTR